ncbi:HEPN domain-containing protein [Vibrio parahaemolyticus]|uniref:HEPN domain-containing protein n=1 Tax=Vibrio parahaemolyticus TaxID=670 RepID=UPI000420BCFB|nr:HEPN domain-containing protein [Vibrio parahaemolyticus]
MRIVFNDFVTRSFRDVADQDYIAARLCYQNNLMIQFTWSALQAVEKYLKSILLYNRVSAKKLNHDLCKSLRRVESIEDLGFELPDDCREFIEFLNIYGANRYLSHAHYNLPHQIVDLDKTVWCLRRYCYDMRQVVSRGGESIDLFDINKKRIKNAESMPYIKCRMFTGHLEKVIKSKSHDQRKPLVWQNLYFGELNRKAVHLPNRFNAINPTPTLHPEVILEIEKYVTMPKTLIEAYKMKLTNNST